MTKQLRKKNLNRCFSQALGQLNQRDLKQEALDGEAALSAAARLVEASAYNLAREVDSEDVIDLMMLSQQLDEFAKYVATIRAEARAERGKLN